MAFRNRYYWLMKWSWTTAGLFNPRSKLGRVLDRLGEKFHREWLENVYSNTRKVK